MQFPMIKVGTMDHSSFKIASYSSQLIIELHSSQCANLAETSFK